MPKLGFQTDSISFNFYANSIEAIRRATGLGKVVVVGHSHHGNVALEYAKRHPQNVPHVVLIGTPPVDVALTVDGAERYWESHASQERKSVLAERRRAITDERMVSLSPKDAYVAQYVADAPLYWHPRI